jgi:hypothetical protein
MDFDAVADELYALRPEEFTAARSSAVAAARTAGDRQLADRIGTLRKPSLAAWASNLLVRSRPGDVEPLLRLGEGLRQAHRSLDRTQLRELSRQQHALIRALSAQARQLAVAAGHPIGEGVQREVENTLHAVLADPEAAEAWASGRLAKPLSAAVGFPAAVPESAVTERAGTQRRPSAAPAPSRPDRKAGEQQRRRLAQARRDAEAADRELRAMKDEAAAAGQAAQEATQQVDRLQRRVGELSEELARAREEHQQARFAERSARERARTADRRVREADRKAASAAAQLERLTSSDDR